LPDKKHKPQKMPLFEVMKVLIQFIWLLLFNSATSLPQGLVGEGSLLTESRQPLVSHYYYNSLGETSGENSFVADVQELELEEEDDSDDQCGNSLFPNFSVFYYSFSPYLHRQGVKTCYPNTNTYADKFPIFLRHCSLII